MFTSPAETTFFFRPVDLLARDVDVEPGGGLHDAGTKGDHPAPARGDEKGCDSNICFVVHESTNHSRPLISVIFSWNPVLKILRLFKVGGEIETWLQEAMPYLSNDSSDVDYTLAFHFH